MRLHIEIDDRMIAAIDELAGPRNRSRFIRDALDTAMTQHRRRELIRSARASIDGEGHDWDDDPAKWVRAQRRSNPRKVG